MTRAKVILTVALAVSIAANGYLLATRVSGATKPSTTVEHDVHAVASLGGERPRLPPVPALEHDLSKLDRATLEQRLIDAQAQLEKLLPLSERWARGLRSAPNEARVRPFLDKVFERKSPVQQPAYSVECRDDVCKISVLDSSNLAHDWMEMLQTSPEGHGLFYAHSFGGNDAYARLNDPKRTPALTFVAQIAQAFIDSAAVADCKKQNATVGTMTLTVSLDPTARRFNTSASGPLADTTTGKCIRNALDAVLISISIPPDVTSMADLPIPVQVP